MTIERLSVHVLRAPCPAPVATSFGVMRDRPAVFLRVDAADGAHGWGEIFANWPSAGAEHRARLLMEDLAPLILGAPSDAPPGLWRLLTAQTRIRALQCGEPGPFAQVLAGLDTALSDLNARRADLPLARWLTADAPLAVPAYASGIAIRDGSRHIESARKRGLAAFKVKVGFDMADDLACLGSLTRDLRDGEALFADANQAWTLEQALDFLRHAPALGWLEEPLPADRPAAEWETLSRASSIPLAGGENIAGTAEFEAALTAGHLKVLQPDVAKWGGVSGCIEVARRTVAAGSRYCPHFLGGGIGLLASAHLLAAAGGDGLLELDVNENPLRNGFFRRTRSRQAGSRFPPHRVSASRNCPRAYVGTKHSPSSSAPETLQPMISSERSSVSP